VLKWGLLLLNILFDDFKRCSSTTAGKKLKTPSHVSPKISHDFRIILFSKQTT
jgi:hypothetical protein